MTHRGPFQPLLFCDSVKGSCQIYLIKHTSDFWPSISWQMGRESEALVSEDATEEPVLRCRGKRSAKFLLKEPSWLCLAWTSDHGFSTLNGRPRG